MFGINRSLWKGNNPCLAGGSCSEGLHPGDHVATGFRSVCAVDPKYSCSQPGFWDGEVTKKRFTLTMDLFQPSWSTPRVVFVLVGKPSCVTRSSPCPSHSGAATELLEFPGMVLFGAHSSGNYYFHEETFLISALPPALCRG